VGEDLSVGVGEEVRVSEGEEVSVGEGDDVSVGVGEGVGVGKDVIVGAGVGDVVGTVVSGGATTVIYPERLRVLTIVRFWTVRFTVYVPGATYTCCGFRRAATLVLNHAPSPNDQFQREGDPPVEVSENCTVSGAEPICDEAVKFRSNGGIPIAYLRLPLPPSR
jgi:hypothetical protein